MRLTVVYIVIVHTNQVTRQTKRGHSTLTEDDRATAHNHKLNAEKPCGLSQQPTATRTPHTRRDRPGQPLERPTDARNTRRTRDASSVQSVLLFHATTESETCRSVARQTTRRWPNASAYAGSVFVGKTWSLGQRPHACGQFSSMNAGRRSHESWADLAHRGQSLYLSSHAASAHLTV